MTSPAPRPPRDLVGLLVLAAIVLALLAAWWLFPLLYGAISHGDCVAAGRTDC